MSDPKIRAAERRYQETGLPEDLRKLNLLRRRAGMLLTREPGWIEEITEQLVGQLAPDGQSAQQLYDGEPTGWWALPNGLQAFEGFIHIEEYHSPIYVSVRRRIPDDSALRITLSIDHPAVYVRYVQGMPGALTQDGLRINRVGTNAEHPELQSGNPQQIPTNGFPYLDGEDALEEMLTLLHQAIKDSREAFIQLCLRDPVNLDSYLRFIDDLYPDDKYGHIKPVVESRQFLDRVGYVFVRHLEHIVERCDLYFDNEGGWPITIKDGYLTTTPGYSDHPADELDPEDIDANTEGAKRGEAYLVADRLSEILNDYDEINVQPRFAEIDGDEEPWEVDYELEEVDVGGDDPEDIELVFAFPAVRKVSIALIQHMLKLYMDEL